MGRIADASLPAMKLMTKALCSILTLVASAGCAVPTEAPDGTPTIADGEASPSGIVIVPKLFLPNLTVQGSFIQYQDATGFWRVKAYVSNTGSTPGKVGTVWMQLYKDNGMVVFYAGSAHHDWDDVELAPGQTLELPLYVPGTTYYNGKLTPIGSLPSVAEYKLLVSVDYVSEGSGAVGTIESNETDNERFLDLH